MGRRHRRRGIGGVRPGEPPERGPEPARPRAGGRAPGLAPRPVHPHAGRADVPDRQPLLRLEVRVGAGAVHGRPPGLARAGQGPRRQQQHQRDDLPARQPARLRALGGRSGHGDVVVRPLPAVLQADGGLHRGRARRPVAGSRRTADAGARPGDESVVPGLVRGRRAGGLLAYRGRQRLPAGGRRTL